MPETYPKKWSLVEWHAKPGGGFGWRFKRWIRTPAFGGGYLYIAENSKADGN
jgi:hypothetical protein